MSSSTLGLWWLREHRTHLSWSIFSSSGLLLLTDLHARHLLGKVLIDRAPVDGVRIDALAQHFILLPFNESLVLRIGEHL